MSLAFDVRKAESDDVEGVQRVYASSWAEAYIGVISEEILQRRTADPAQFYPEKKIRANLGDDESLYLVATIDEEIIAISHFCWGEHNTHRFVESNSAQLRAIYVDPAYWGQGIGTALLEAGFDRLAATVDNVMIECLAENERAQEFYESYGFDQYGSRSMELFGEDQQTTLYHRPIR